MHPKQDSSFSEGDRTGIASSLLRLVKCLAHIKNLTGNKEMPGGGGQCSGSGIIFLNPDPTFSCFRIRILFRILHEFCLIFFLTEILPLYSHLGSVIGCILGQDICCLWKFCWIKRNSYIFIWHFCGEIVKFYQFFKVHWRSSKCRSEGRGWET